MNQQQLSPFFNSSVVDFIQSNYYIRSVFWILLEWPLLMLYLNGPCIYGYGFWGGITFESICSQLTSVPATHWILNPLMCSLLIQQRFNTFLVCCYISCYFIGLIWLILMCSLKCCRWVRHPITTMSAARDNLGIK